MRAAPGAAGRKWLHAMPLSYQGHRPTPGSYNREATSALLAVARRRAQEPILLEDVEVEVSKHDDFDDMIDCYAASAHLDDPVFTPIRADLARLYLAHKAELKLDDTSDDEIVAKVDAITGALMAAGTVAVAREDHAWMERHAWFAAAVERLFADQPAVPVDG